MHAAAGSRRHQPHPALRVQHHEVESLLGRQAAVGLVVHLGVRDDPHVAGHQPAGRRDEQRVDLHELGALLPEQVVGAAGVVDQGRDQRRLDARSRGRSPDVPGPKPRRDRDRDQAGVLMRLLLDVDAPGRAEQQHQLAPGRTDRDPQVQLLDDLDRLLHQHGVDPVAAHGAAQELLGRPPGLGVLDDQDAAVAPAPADRHLRFDRHPAAKLPRDRQRLVRRDRHLAVRDRDARFLCDSLGDVLQQLHQVTPPGAGRSRCGGSAASRHPASRTAPSAGTARAASPSRSRGRRRSASSGR